MHSTLGVGGRLGFDQWESPFKCISGCLSDRQIMLSPGSGIYQSSLQSVLGPIHRSIRLIGDAVCNEASSRLEPLSIMGR